MLLEPEGFISPHEDMHEHKLSPINIALNNPKTCKMKMINHKGFVPFEPGVALMLDVGNTHAVYNKSDEEIVLLLDDLISEMVSLEMKRFNYK